MNNSDSGLLRFITGICGAWVLVACIYVCGLLLHLPLPVICCFIAAGIALWTALLHRANPPTGYGRIDARLIVVAGTAAIAAAFVIKAHGAYDAWLHWNSLARYMSRPGYFRMLAEPYSLWHADYPPGLPAPIALIWRLTGADAEDVPRVVGFLFYLSIPLLLCQTALAVSGPRWLWVAVLALFTVNIESLSQGLNQYADIPLALLLLLSLMLADVIRSSGNLRLFPALGLMLGGCLIMKNEGLVVVAAFLATHLRLIGTPRRSALLAAGALLPVVTLIAYKRYIPTPNDVVQGLSGSVAEHLLSAERYRIIVYYFARFTLLRFPLFLLFFGWMVVRRPYRRFKFPDAATSCVLLCAAGYLLVYLTTDIGLSWLVPTSMNRLMMQLLPAGVYCSLMRLRNGSSEN